MSTATIDERNDGTWKFVFLPARYTAAAITGTAARATRADAIGPYFPDAKKLRTAYRKTAAASSRHAASVRSTVSLYVFTAIAATITAAAAHRTIASQAVRPSPRRRVVFRASRGRVRR